MLLPSCILANFYLCKIIFLWILKKLISNKFNCLINRFNIVWYIWRSFKISLLNYTSCISCRIALFLSSILSNLFDSWGLESHLATMEQLPVGLLPLRVLPNTPTTLDSGRVSDRRRLYGSCLSEKEWNCRWGGQLHGSSPCISRFLVLCKCDCPDSTRSLREIDLREIDWLITNEVAHLQKDR